MTKRTVAFVFVSAFGVFLVQHILVAPTDELSSPGSSANSGPANPVPTIVRRAKSFPPDRHVRPTDNLLPQLEAALLAYDGADNRGFLAPLAELVRDDPAAAARFAE